MLLHPGIPEGQGFELHTFGVRALSVNSDVLKDSFVRHLAKVAGEKVSAFYFTANFATGDLVNFVVQGL